MIQNLCEYAIDKSNGVYIDVICKITGKRCDKYRYCNEIKKPTMGFIYLKYGCKIKDNKNKERDLLLNKMQSEFKNNIVICKVNYYRHGNTSVSYQVDNKTYSMFIKGKYSGNLIIEYIGDTVTRNSIIKINQIEKE